MARGRMISKAISLDDRVNALSNDTARLLFTWLIPHLDCEGRMYGDAQTVKSIVFPRRCMDVRTMQKHLDELAKSGLILRYSNVDGTYICCPHFEKHQTGLQKSKEASSQIPPPSPELLQSEVGLTLTQDKEEDKDKEQEEGSSCLSKEDVVEAYERAIGSLSEDMENEIELAVIRFTAQWVSDAIREAAKRNKKTWVYVAGILKNWERFGKDASMPGGQTKRKKRREYTPQEAAEIDAENERSIARHNAAKKGQSTGSR